MSRRFGINGPYWYKALVFGKVVAASRDSVVILHSSSPEELSGIQKDGQLDPDATWPFSWIVIGFVSGFGGCPVCVTSNSQTLWA